MRKLLVLADDFTGGLDTGAQFAAAGIPTVVTTNPAYCAADHEEDTVLVVDVETRHLLPEKARQFVLLSGDEIVWLVGRRIDDRYRLTAETENVLRITKEII